MYERRLRGVDGKPLFCVTGDKEPEAEPERGLILRGDPFAEAALLACANRRSAMMKVVDQEAGMVRDAFGHASCDMLVTVSISCFNFAFLQLEAGPGHIGAEVRS